MDTFGCYCRNNLAVTTINKRLPRCFDRLSNLVTALHHPSWAVGLSYHCSSIIHLRIAMDGQVQTFLAFQTYRFV